MLPGIPASRCRFGSHSVYLVSDVPDLGLVVLVEFGSVQFHRPALHSPYLHWASGSSLGFRYVQVAKEQVASVACARRLS